MNKWLILFFLIFINGSAIAQMANSNSIGITFLQFQNRNALGYFNFDPIFNLGIAYEHKVGKKYSLILEGMYKSGLNRIYCIDCPGAKGKMNEWNIKFGTARYFSISERWQLFGQLKLFYEKTNVPNGTSDWSLSGNTNYDWYRYIDYYGFEVSFGAAFQIMDAFALFFNPSLQMGKQTDDNPVFKNFKRTVINFAYFENIGVKYRF